MEWLPVTLADLAVVVSGFGTIVLIAILSRQLSIMKNEAKSRLRPWIMPVETIPEYVKLEDGSTLEYSKAMAKMEKDPAIYLDIIHYKIVVTNSGAIPAKILFTSIGQKEKFSRDIFKNVPMSNSITVVPNHDFKPEVDVPYKELSNGGKYYIGISIEYTVDKKIFQSGAIYETRGNFRVLLEDWHEKV